MKKGQIFEGTVEYVDFPNKGRIIIEGEKITVKDVIPGQKIRGMISKKRNGNYEGRCLEILEASPIENGERCPHFGKCGGCIYQPVPYKEQLKIKEMQIKKLLDGVCDNYVFEGIKASPIHEEYRNKMEFSFGDEFKDGPLSLGMHKKGSFHDIVTVSHCHIVDADFRTILTETLKFFADRNIPFYKKMQHTGYLRHLLVRKAKKTGEILVDLVTTTQLEDVSLMEDYKNMLLELLEQGKLLGGYAGILHTYNDSLADAVINERTVTLYGQNYFFEELNGLIFKITPFSFFQTNSMGAEVLYDMAKKYIGDTNDKIVYDLYSGTGTIAQMMASAAKQVVGVEIVEEAVIAARENAALNGLTNCEFIAGDVLKVIDEIETKPDLLMLDPPRDGINPKALPKLAAYGVPRIVYVSCKASSLARDIVLFKEYGYEVERAVAVDMFPGTANIETVVLLSKLHEAKHHVRVKLDMDEMDITSAESKATYEEIKKYVAEHNDGMKAKSEEARQPVCPKDKEEAIVLNDPPKMVHRSTKIWEFFDNLNEAVYVVDMDTHELIYLNKKVMNTYNLHSMDEIAGKKCYEFLQACNAPCALCNIDALEEGKFIEWQHYNPRLNRFFILKDTMVIDEGRRCRIEIAIDNSIHEQKYQMFLAQQNHETLANEGIRLAMKAESPDKSLDVILEFLGQVLHAERTYIFEKNESGGDDNTYEWVAKGVTPSIDDLQNLPPEVCADWYKAFNEDRNVIIKDIESIRESDPVKYDILKMQNILSLVVIPIYNNTEVIGFYGVDNPKEVSFEYIQNMLQIVGHFISSCLKRRKLVKQLEEMSYHDPLTKLGNRFAMDKYMLARDSDSSLGVVYCDITGLKKVNDTEGHMAGDNLILRACDSLKEVFAGYGLFRIGGDELLALCPGIEHEKLTQGVAGLKQASLDHSVALAVGAVWYEKKDGGIDNLLVEAERLMYEDKAEYYKKNGIDRRK